MFEQIDELSEKIYNESSGQITIDMQGEVWLYIHKFIANIIIYR